MILVDLVYNLSVLVALSVLSGFIDSRFHRTELSGKILQGLLFGITAVIGIHNPFVLTEGIIFDGRSIVISLCTLFFGPLSGGISSILAILYRNYIGGSGAIMGTLVISSSFLIGYIFFRWHNQSPENRLTKTKLYLFGVLVHAAMLFFVLALPAKNIVETYKIISVTVIGIYPIASLIISKILLDQKENQEYLDRIKNSEELFRTTLYSIGDAVITTDKTGKILQINPVAENLTGWLEQDAKNKKLEDVFKIINEETRNTVESPVNKVLREGKVVGLANHTLLVSKDGKEIPIADSGAPIRNEKGLIIGVVLVFRDQTEERASQKALQESKDQYMSLVESTEDSVYLIDHNMRFLYANKKYLTSHNLTIDQIIGINYEKFHSAERTKEFTKKIRQVINSRTSMTYEHISDNDKKVYLRTLSPVHEQSESEITKVTVISKDITQFKSLQETLKEMNEIFRLFMEHNPIYVFIKDENIRSVYLSKNYEKMLGRPLSELLGKTMDELFPSDLAKSMIEDDKKILREGKPYEFVEELEGRVYSTLKFPISINGIPKYLAGYTTDITERISSEAALKESEERYRSLFNNNHSVMLLIEPDTQNIVDANPAACNYYGWSREEMINKKISEINTLSSEEINTELRRAYDEKRKQFFFKHRLANGTTRNVEVFSGPIHLNNKIFLYSIVHDITDRIKAEEALRESEDKLKSIFQSAPVGIGLVSNRVILEANDMLCDMTGYTRKELLGQSARILYVNDEDYDCVGKEKYRQIYERGTGSVETRWIRKNGEIINIILSSTPLDINDLSKGVTFSALDITFRKQAEKELIRAKELAEQSDKLKSEFLAQMSHEIRSPLNIILNFSRLIKSELNNSNPEEMVENFNAIEIAGSRIIRTIDMILNMAELQTGTYEPINKQVDLKTDILEQVEKQYHFTAVNKNVDLKFTYKTNNTKVTVDEYSVGQVFANLIDNAIKYTEQGEVHVVVDRNEDDKLKIIVSDTGIGISDDYIPKLFLPFSQEDQGYSRKFEGNGLGLALVKRYCDLNKALVSVQSKKGAGTSVTIIFS